MLAEVIYSVDVTKIVEHASVTLMVMFAIGAISYVTIRILNT